MDSHQLLESVSLDKSETVFGGGGSMHIQPVQEEWLSTDSILNQLHTQTN